MHETLREATAGAHRELDGSLDLVGGSLTRERLIVLLERFHGFYAAWEPVVSARLGGEAWAGHSRLPHVAADLARFGKSARQIAALPTAAAAARLASTEGAAWGSLYVIEGSSLGGRVIARRLAAEVWWPTGGLGTFDPYADAAGPNWRHFLGTLGRQPAALHETIVSGAVATFAALMQWLEPAFAPAAVKSRPGARRSTEVAR